jgi:hypothetical protein
MPSTKPLDPHILTIRKDNVILDAGLAEIDGVATRRGPVAHEAKTKTGAQQGAGRAPRSPRYGRSQIMKKPFPMPDWKWGTTDGSREFDRLVDRQMTLREKLEWLEESEVLAQRMQAALKARQKSPESPTAGPEPHPSQSPRQASHT